MQATKVRVSHEDFDASAELAPMAGGDAGASVSFIGMVRADGSVLAMELEHYPAMTEKAIAGIIEQARGRWSLEAVTVIHRVGKLLPGDQIVFCAVTSKHRCEAFAAC